MSLMLAQNTNRRWPPRTDGCQIFCPVRIVGRGLLVPADRLAPVLFAGHKPAARGWWTPVARPAGVVRPVAGVAVIAALGDLIAAPPGVPCVVAPVDPCRVAHQQSPLETTSNSRARPTLSIQHTAAWLAYASKTDRDAYGVVIHVDRKNCPSPLAPLRALTA